MVATLGINSAATINGGSDTITGGAGDTATLVGNTDRVTLGTGGTLNLTGTAETVNRVELTIGDLGHQQHGRDLRSERYPSPAWQATLLPSSWQHQ